MAKLDSGISKKSTLSLADCFRSSIEYRALTSRDTDAETWFAGRTTTTEEYKDLVKQTLASPSQSSKYIFTDWSNTLIRKDAYSEVYRMLNHMSLEFLLKDCGAHYVGDLSGLSSEEIFFIVFAIGSFEELLEIYAVDELGYTDIWLVFPVFNGDAVLTYIRACQEFLKKHNLSNVYYRTLCPENFCGDVDNPLLHIKFREGSL